MPVYILNGDPFLTAEALRELRTQVGPAELLEANSHWISGGQVTLAGLQGICDAIPFLAQKRLVVVEGFLRLFEERSGRGRGSGGRPAGGPAGWAELEEYLRQMPSTTLLVFLEGTLQGGNSMLARLSSLAQVQEFRTPRGEELARWIRNRAEIKGAKITIGALRLLGEYVGGNLQTLDNELEKLLLYAVDRPIEEEDVTTLVPQVREASIFAAVDAILEGRQALALRLMHRLRSDGANLSYILAMIARQLRLITLAKDLLRRGVAPGELGGRLGIRADFALRRTLDQARKSPWPRLVALYQRLLEMDLAVKEGRLEEDLALDLLVAEVATLA